MKKFLLFIIVLASHISWGQDETRTINNSDFPVALYAGIPEINIPLFKIETANSNFSPELRLENNLYACTSSYFSTGDIGDGWSLNIKGSISMTGEQISVNGGPTITYFDQFKFSKLLSSGNDGEGVTTYNYSVMGLTGKFKLAKEGTVFKIKVIEQNDYALVSMDYTVSGTDFDLHSFLITDKSGFQYLFANYKEQQTIQMDEKSTFFLSKVTDNNGKELLTYNYDSTILSSIDVLNHGTLSLSPPNATKRTLIYTDLKGNQNQKIELMFSSFGKVLLTQVKFFNNDDSKSRNYTIKYKNHQASSLGTYYGFRHGACSFRNLTPDKIYFDQGAVEKITTPEGATTFYQYEPNTVGFDVSGLNPGGAVYKETIKKIRKANAANYTFEPVTLTYNSTYGGYLVDLNDYFPFSNPDEPALYVEYKANDVELFPPSSLFPEGKYHTPGLKVGTYITTPALGLDPKIISQYTCTPGEKIAIGLNEKFLLKIEPEYQSYYQYVRAYYKKYKPDNELSYFAYSLAPRIKRIKSFSTETSSISSTENVVSEQLFNYGNPNQANSSSGYSKYYYFVDSNIEETIATDYRLYNYTDLTLYKNVSVETPGIGKVQYSFVGVEPGNLYFPPNSVKMKRPESIKKYNAAGQLTESTTFERTYTASTVVINDTEISPQPFVTYEKITTESFENGAAQGLKTITESTFDTLTRNLAHRKITDVAKAQVFQEQFTYQKLGSAYFRTAVEKTKNSSALNRSIFAYQQQGLTQAYNLKTVSVAKENRPLEVDKEITRYDEYGNILEYKTKDGLVVSQVWGYNNSKLVAELKNVSYSDISVTVRNNITNYSNQGGLNYSETNLTTALNSLRNLFPSGFVTTYTYKPLVGITSLTDANGRKETYQYDSFNRLYRVLNNEGLVTKEYTYNIKN